MTLVELLNKANEGYPDGFLDEYYDHDTGALIDREHQNWGDTLAQFVVVELVETFDPTASDDEQIVEALRVMHNAARDLQGVVLAIGGAS